MADFRNITLYELEIFLQLAQRRSQRAVARALRLTPSHVSKVIKRLELKLGKGLVRTSSSGIILTRDGVSFIQYAEKMLETMGEFHLGGEIEDRRGMEKSVLTIGTVSFLGQYMLSPVLKLMQQSNSAHRLRIIDMSPDLLIEEGLKGVFEMALHVGKMEWTSGWSTKKAGDLTWGLFSSVHHPLARSKNVTASAMEVQQFPFIVPTYWNLQNYVAGNDLFPVSWSKRIKGHEASTAETALYMASHSDHLVFVPKIVAAPLVATHQVIEIKMTDRKEVKRPVYLSVNAGKIKAPFRALLLQSVAKSLW